MTVSPINVYNEDEKAPAPLEDSETGQPQSASAAPPRALPKNPLPQPSIMHMTSLDTSAFFADTPQAIALHKQTQRSAEQLKTKRSELESLVFGRFVAHTDAAQVLQAARDFYALLSRGFSKEANIQFRQMSADLQEYIGYRLLNEPEFDLNAARPALAALLKDAAVSPELKAQIALKLTAAPANPLGQVFGQIKNSWQTANTYLNELEILSGKPEFVRQAKSVYRTGDAELIAAYDGLAEYLLNLPQALDSVFQLFSAGRLGSRELAEYLDGVVLGLDRAYHGAAALFKAQTGADFTPLLAGLQSALDQNNKKVADILRRVYQNSGDSIVLKLSEAAYVLLNASLSRLGEPCLSAMFGDLGGITLSDPQELAFLNTCYEYTQEHKAVLAAALELVGRIFRVDAEDMAQWREEKLEELRKLEAYLAQVKLALREFAKKLEDIQKIKKLENAQVVINTYTRGIGELEEILNSKITLRKTSALREALAKYRVLLDSARWQSIVNIICAHARTAGS